MEQMEHFFKINDLNPHCNGTCVEHMEHLFVFNDLAFARRVALMGYWYQMV